MIKDLTKIYVSFQSFKKITLRSAREIKNFGEEE